MSRWAGKMLPQKSIVSYSDPTRSIVVIWVKIIQTELKVEIYSKCLVRAIGKVLHVKLS